MKRRVSSTRFCALGGSSMKVKEIIDIVQNDGWYLVRIRGCHRQFHHDTKVGTVTVAGKLSHDLLRGIENSILKQAGLK